MPPKVAFSILRDLPRYVPGQHHLGGAREPIVLSANENPYGPSHKALEAIARYQNTVHRYPPEQTALKEKLIAHHNLDGLDGEIVIGAGSDELLSLLARGFARPGSTVLMSEYGFLMYPIAAQSVGAIPRKILEQNYRTDPQAILAACDDQTSMIYLANPNNPTGSYLSAQEVIALVDGLPDHVLLVLDCAYSECVQAEDYSNHHDLVATGRVAITHTFSKLYGLAGQRVGWGFMPPAIADILERLRSPFNMTTLSLKAAEAALDDQEYLHWCQQQNRQQYARLVQACTELSLPLQVLPSMANFALWKFPDNVQAAQLEQNLQNHGIITRNMRGYGLHDCLRISIGTAEENTALIAALQAIYA